MIFNRSSDGVTIYYDARHRIQRTRMIGGSVHERVYERQSDGTYREQLLTIHSPEGDVTVVEYASKQTTGHRSN